MKIEKKLLSCLSYLGLNLGSIALYLPGVPFYGLNYPVDKDVGDDRMSSLKPALGCRAPGLERHIPHLSWPQILWEKKVKKTIKSLFPNWVISHEVKINLGKGITTPKNFNNRYSANKGFKLSILYLLHLKGGWCTIWTLYSVILKPFYPSLQVHKSHSTRFLIGKLAFWKVISEQKDMVANWHITF